MYTPKESGDEPLVRKMKEIIRTYPKAGSGMITMKLRQSGVVVNHKRVERLYSERKMQLKNRIRRKKYKVVKRKTHLLTNKPNEWLAADFVIDSVGNKRPLKTLTVIDPVTKTAPTIVPDFSIRGLDVSEVLQCIWDKQGRFKYLQTDNGPEFRCTDLEKWCKNHDVVQVFSRPGKPTDNCFIESFNRIFREECLNLFYFSNLSEARDVIERWRVDYNENRPQAKLGGLTPCQFRDRLLSEKTLPVSGRI